MVVAQQAGDGIQQNPDRIDEIDFQKYWLVLRRRWLPAALVFAAAVAAAAFAALAEEDTYWAEGKILFRSDRSASLTGLQEDRGQVDVLTFQGEPLETQAELVRSLPVMADTIEALDLRNGEGDPMTSRELLARVTVQPVGGTELLQIGYTSSEPEKAAAIVNQVIESYRQRNIESNREEAAAARAFIEEQLPTTENEVLAAEAALRRFKESNSVIALEEEASESVEVVAGLDGDLSRAEAELADVSAQMTELQGRLGVTVPEALALSSLNQAEGVQTALADLQTVQAELAELRSRYQPQHPEVQIQQRRLAEAEALLGNRIQEVVGQELTIPVSSIDPGRLQLGDLRQSLLADMTRLEVQRQGLADRQSQLESFRANYLGRLERLPGLEKTQRQLERQLQAAQSTYETLLSQLQEIRVVENQTIGNVRIVSLADIPEVPRGSNGQLYLAAGFFMGALLAIATAFLLDILDGSVKSIKEAKQLYGYTLLGVIPLVKDVARRDSSELAYPRLLVNQASHAGVREAYQILQANLKFLQSDSELKTVVITSAVPGEGKSEVSANLATALAQVGRRVLLVDADMRYPRQHHAFQIVNGEGLSHVITGQARADGVVKQVMENLDVLTAGAVPPNPVALLDSNRMETLLRGYSAHYDMVIIDAPPLVGYADASILGKLSDGTLLVTRPGVMDYAQGRIAKDTLVQSNQRVLGMVANGINPASEPDAHFYYSRQSYQQLANPRLQQPAIDDGY